MTFLARDCMIQGQPPLKAENVSAPASAALETRPKFRAQRHLVKVREVTWVTPSTYLIYFTMDNNGPQPVFDFEPGQFLSIFVEKEGKTINRPYSIASSPTEKDAIELCIKVVEGGFMSNYLKERQPGDRYRIMAPLGAFILREPIATDIAFISTGTGVAPFVGMTKWMIHHNLLDEHEVHMITGVRYVKELLYHDLFQEWERKYPNFHYHPTISRPETPEWKGHVGYVQKVIEQKVTNPRAMTGYICGLHEMVEQTKDLCQRMGFGTVRVEKWD